MLKSLVCVLALAATATAANAETLSVQTADLNLSTEAGVKALDRRIQSAARTVCGADELDTGTRIRSADRIECMKRAVGEARQKVAALSQQQRPNS